MDKGNRTIVKRRHSNNIRFIEHLKKARGFIPYNKIFKHSCYNGMNKPLRPDSSRGKKQPSSPRPSAANMPSQIPHMHSVSMPTLRDDDEDEDEVEIKLSPSGSVLMAAPNPYDKAQRIKEANNQLKSIRPPPPKIGRVRFDEKVTMFSEEFEEPEIPSPSVVITPPINEPPKSNKVLLVTVPTGFSSNGECLSDEGEEIIDDTLCLKNDEHKNEEFEFIIDETETESSEQINQVEEITETFSACTIKTQITERPLSGKPRPVSSKIENKVKKDLKRDKNKKNGQRPNSAPSGRTCLKEQDILSGQTIIKLPHYNGLRSEYGLSAEQLQERKWKRQERIKSIRKEKEEKYLEEKKRQKQNDQIFATWLVKKKKEAASKHSRRRLPINYFKTLPAPIYHLDKLGAVRKKVLSKKEHTCYSLNEFFKSAKPHEQKTYRIYLGLCVE